MSQQASISVAMQASQTEDLEASVRSMSPRMTFSKAWSEGTGDDQADVHVTVAEALVAATPEEWDLRSGGGLDHDMDGLEGVVVFAKVKALMLKNLSATGYLTLAPTAASGWVALFTGTVIVPPLGAVVIVAPVGGVVVDTTHRGIKLTTDVNCDIEMFIIGVEA